MARFVLVVVGLLAAPLFGFAAEFRAGAAAVDVTPERFPVAVNCGFIEVTGTIARDRLHARAIVLDDGTTRLCIVIVDNCMMPREFLDRAKASIAAETKIPADRQSIAATHTHTAPAVMGCLGSDPDPVYPAFLERQLVQVVRQAIANLVPAKAGWAVVSAASFTNNRQWILRSDKVRNDPFGNPTMRSNMHPGYQNADFVGPSGPTDPWLSILSLRTADDKPLAVLANFSMHYFGSAPVSADYFGKFCSNLETKVAPNSKAPQFVAIMSQGTAGDLHWMDYSKPKADQTIEKYAEALAALAAGAIEKVVHKTDVSLAMAETLVAVNRRTPDADRLAWAQKIVAGLNGKKPTTQPEIYAREAVMLHAEPTRELKLQAIRIGDFGIAAIPNEVFAITGLKIKAQSPLAATFAIELANGADGYIPPAEQHALGGYTTWPARSAGLEVGAESKIVEAVLGLLEKVAAKKRRNLPDPGDEPYAKRVLASKPVGYWRLGELAGPNAADLVGKNPATFEPGIVFGLDGPLSRPFDGQKAMNRAAHFAGGRLAIKLPELGEKYSVELWFSNGFPGDVRDTTGTLLTMANGDTAGDRLVLDGKNGTPNALAISASLTGESFHSTATAAFRTWTHVAFVRDGPRVVVYLDSKAVVDAVSPRLVKANLLCVGGRPDRAFGFEGRIAEVAVFDRALTINEVGNRVKK